MTEQEWLASKDPIAMLDWVMQLHFRPSDRKLRLVACACSRLDARGKNHLEAIEAVETHADGHDIDLNPHSNWTIASPEYSPVRMLSYLLTDAGFVGKGKQIADILRDIIGNPFQPVTVEERHPSRWPGREYVYRPVWLTPLVLQLAEAAYTVRTGTGTLDNDALAVLSDALEEAGLDGLQVLSILAHLRDPGPHYRGCWATDILLGRE